MGFKFDSELQKFQEAGNIVNTVGATLKSDRHISTLIKAAHKLLSSEFVLHMTEASIRNPGRFTHMYEWGMVGDPNGRLWRDILKGSGSRRFAYFEFVASKKTVPVKGPLKAVGVKQRHIFVWKAMVLERGLQVNISPKLAKYLVFIDKDPNQQNMGTNTGGFKQGGLVYYKGTITLARAGNPAMWGSFTNEWEDWWSGPQPGIIIQRDLTSKTIKTIRKTVAEAVGAFAGHREKNKTFEITALKVDPMLEEKIQQSLEVEYTRAAAQRTVI